MNLWFFLWLPIKIQNSEMIDFFSSHLLGVEHSLCSASGSNERVTWEVQPQGIAVFALMRARNWSQRICHRCATSTCLWTAENFPCGRNPGAVPLNMLK